MITITGSSLGSDSTHSSVTINNQPCMISTGSQQDTVLTCTSPVNPGGDRTLLLNVSGQTTSALFMYDGPSISNNGISPQDGNTAGNINVTITGTSFDMYGNVSVGGNNCTVQQWSQTSVICLLPAGQGTNQLIQLTTYQGLTTTSYQYNYAPPAVDTLNPTTGSTAGGTYITLTGSNFGSSGNVTIDTNNVCSIISYSDSSIVCSIPAGEGTGKLVVLTVAGQSSTALTFAYNPPSITSLTPSSGITDGGYNLTIYGSDFGVAPSITVGISSCPRQFVNASCIICTMPTGSGAGVPIQVTASQQLSNTLLFNYNPPTITSIYPQNMTTSGGSIVTVIGTSMYTTGTITVGGGACTFVSWNDTVITCQLPQNQGVNLPVVVTVNSQTSLSSNGPAVSYSYAPPTVYTISPTNGPTQVCKSNQHIILCFSVLFNLNPMC